MRHAMIAALGLAASACVSAPDSTPINHVLTSVPAQVVHDLGVDGEAIALAFSGGGARAASFSYGVLLQLREMKDSKGRLPARPRRLHHSGVRRFDHGGLLWPARA